MKNLIIRSLPDKAKIVRIHVSGDFFSQTYFDAWYGVARIRPEVIFYAYTKSIPYWIKRLDSIPANFRLTASHGGRSDKLITDHGLKSATVLMTQQEADILNLEVDHDDTHAQSGAASFALLIHGTQKAGTDQSKASYANRKPEHFNRRRMRLQWNQDKVQNRKV
jgi:hypothetical protein